MKEFLGLDKAERMQNIEQASCTDLAVLVKQLGVCSNEGSTIIFERCLKILTDDSRKEYALNLLLSLLQWNGKTIEPMIVSKFPLLLRLHGDRSSRVRGSDNFKCSTKSFKRSTCVMLLIAPPLAVQIAHHAQYNF